ncbi:Cell surface mannoprotein mp65 [Rhizina undulata]
MLSPRILTTLLCVLPAFLQSIEAQPHGKRHHGARRHLEARDDTYDETSTVTVSATIYVDQYGSTLSPASVYAPITVTKTYPSVETTTTSVAEVLAATSSQEAVVEEVATSAYAAASSAAVVDLNVNVAVPSNTNKNVASASSVYVASASSSSSSSSKPGMVYSPYNSDNSCKSASDVASDIAKISDFSMIRLYGVDCNQIQNVMAAAKPYGIKLFLGIYDLSQDVAQVASLISAVGTDWDYVHTVAIGNEAVNSGSYTADVVVGKVNLARTTLRAAGYTGSVVTVDTFVAIMANPTLCEASDYAAANCHPFFDGGVVASESGSFLTTQSANVAAACPGKTVFITETGWPHQGETNNKAVPSVANQKAAIASIYEAMGKNVILFTSYDDLWKTDTASTFGAEKYWGIQDLSLSS